MSALTDKIKEVVGAIAPTLATGLGGPAAGVAVSAISKALLGKPDATEQEIYDSVQLLTPDKVVELKKAEIEHKAKMRELDVDEVGLYLDDKESARQMQIQANRDSLEHGGSGEHTAHEIAKAYTKGFFFILSVYLLRDTFVPAAHVSSSLDYLMGFLGTGQTIILSFYFGSAIKQAFPQWRHRGEK